MRNKGRKEKGEEVHHENDIWVGQKKEPSLGGLEPPTFRLTAERANQLRHGDRCYARAQDLGPTIGHVRAFVLRQFFYGFLKCILFVIRTCSSKWLKNGDEGNKTF